MAFLYRNVKGYEVRAHSHSGGGDWSCPKKYYWKRLEGWQSREDRVASYFGKAVESAIQFHHHQHFVPGTGIEEFKQLWFQYQDDSTVQYTEKSGNWHDHYQMGVELLGLYESTVQDYPITNAQFQVERKVDLFAEGPYAGLQYVGKVDMVCDTADGPLIVDIKTSANPYFSDPRLASLDDQLRDYSWVFDIPRVAFLVLVKNFSAIDTGDWVTVISGPKAGKKYQVLDASPLRVVILTKSDYEDYLARKKAITGKGAKELKEALLTEYHYKGIIMGRENVTKQRIQFLQAEISIADRLEARRVATHEAMEIADASAQNFFPKKPGVRFPHNVCQNCECLGLCIGDQDMVKEKLIKIDGVF